MPSVLCLIIYEIVSLILLLSTFTGIIRGTKHWSWDMTVTLWSWMQPLLRKVVSKITVESFGDWGTCFATGKEHALKK